MSDLSAAQRKLIYRCTHRGTKELDLILGAFARAHVPEMDAQMLADFDLFTTLPEPVLQEMLTGKAALPQDMPPTLHALLSTYTYGPDPR